jgi:hypothetical protein
MSSLGSIGTARAGAGRISLDGRVVMDRLTALYPALPGEIFFGANPLGMSTSAAEFEGDFISVRTQQAESDLIGKDP